jgi:hypothetical protein
MPGSLRQAVKEERMGQNRTVRVHYCFNQHLGGKLPENCNCRKDITYAEAESLVKQGRADWVILSKTPVNLDELDKFNEERGRFNPPLKSLDNDDYLKKCPVCSRLRDFRKRLCKNCAGRGYQDPVIFWEELSRHTLPEPGGQIVMISQADDKGRFGLALHKKTPRVATVEKQHILRAIAYSKELVRPHLDGRWEAQQRIEEYGLINLLELYGKPQGAPLTEKKIEFILEPEDYYGTFTKGKGWDVVDAQGRKYDWGRPIL